MKKRIITGIVGLLLFVFILWMGKEYYSTVLGFFALATYMEFCKMKDVSWYRPEGIIGLLAVACILGTGLTECGLLYPIQILKNPFNILFPFILFSVWILLSKNSFHLYQMGYLFVGAVYIGYGFSFMIKTMWGPNGLGLTLLVCLVTWSNDIGAYFIGRKWGKRKLWPWISPNKTIEGSVAGLFFGIIQSGVIFLSFSLGSLFTALWLGLFISIVGQLGDLLESAWKRTIGIKDSGTILPGHGGLFDRFDSLLFSFIVLHTLGLLG